MLYCHQKLNPFWLVFLVIISLKNLYLLKYIYGPGSPPYALKHNEVSSTITGSLSYLNASSTFNLAISSGSPYNSGTYYFTINFVTF